MSWCLSTSFGDREEEGEKKEKSSGTVGVVGAVAGDDSAK